MCEKNINFLSYHKLLADYQHICWGAGAGRKVRFARETAAFHHTRERFVAKMQIMLGRFVEWNELCQHNRLYLNVNKTTFIPFPPRAGRMIECNLLRKFNKAID